MSPDPSEAGHVEDQHWAIVERWQEYQGEARANLLRASGITGFYIIELINYHGLRLGFLELPKAAGIDRSFHLAVTALVVAWLVSGWSVFAFLRNRFFPPALKFLSTGLDHRVGAELDAFGGHQLDHAIALANGVGLEQAVLVDHPRVQGDGASIRD